LRLAFEILFFFRESVTLLIPYVDLNPDPPNSTSPFGDKLMMKPSFETRTGAMLPAYWVSAIPAAWAVLSSDPNCWLRYQIQFLGATLPGSGAWHPILWYQESVRSGMGKLNHASYFKWVAHCFPGTRVVRPFLVLRAASDHSASFDGFLTYCFTKLDMMQNASGQPFLNGEK
jgi:hypothetical protein